MDIVEIAYELLKTACNPNDEAYRKKLFEIMNKGKGMFHAGGLGEAFLFFPEAQKAFNTNPKTKESQIKDINALFALAQLFDKPYQLTIGKKTKDKEASFRRKFICLAAICHSGTAQGADLFNVNLLLAVKAVQTILEDISHPEIAGHKKTSKFLGILEKLELKILRAKEAARASAPQQLIPSSGDVSAKNTPRLSITNRGRLSQSHVPPLNLNALSLPTGSPPISAQPTPRVPSPSMQNSQLLDANTQKLLLDQMSAPPPHQEMLLQAQNAQNNAPITPNDPRYLQETFNNMGKEEEYPHFQNKLAYFLSRIERCSADTLKNLNDYLNRVQTGKLNQNDREYDVLDDIRSLPLCFGKGLTFQWQELRAGVKKTLNKKLDKMITTLTKEDKASYLTSLKQHHGIFDTSFIGKCIGRNTASASHFLKKLSRVR